APTVVVADDGAGMSLDDIRRFWMKIGTTAKVAEPVSRKYGRKKTGSKGIGRFSCRRLGRFLKLITTAKIILPNKTSAYQTTIIDFDWLSFTPGTDVESVQCIGTTTTSTRGSTGTTLEISRGTYDEWQVRGFNHLQRQLAVLTTNRGVI